MYGAYMLPNKTLHVPQVGSEVETEDVGESKLLNGSDDCGKPEDDADVRNNDLPVLVRLEHGRSRVEVCASVVSALGYTLCGVMHSRLAPLG